MASETGRMSVSVTLEKQEKLDAIAKNPDRSRNWLVNQAIDYYFEIYDWQTEIIQERLDIASGKCNEPQHQRQCDDYAYVWEITNFEFASSFFNNPAIDDRFIF